MGVIDTLKSFVDSGNIGEKVDEFNELTKGLDEPQLTEIKNYLADKTSELIKSKLAIFKGTVDDSVEDNKEALEIKDVEFSMEGLKQNLNTEFFKNVLKSNEKLGGNDIFGLWLNQKMFELKIDESYKNNISVIIWNKIIKDAGLSSGLSNGFKYVFDKLNEYSKKIKDINVKENIENLKGDFTFGKLSKFIDGFSGLAGSGDKKDEKGKISVNLGGEVQEIPIPKEIEKLIGMLNETVDGYFNNLTGLLKLAEEKKLKEDTRFKNFMNNPMILDELLEKGVYQKDGFNIDIKAGILELGQIDETTLKSVQNEFMAIAVKNTNNVGGTIDSIKNEYKSFADILGKFGIGKGGLEKIKETLYSIPIIGFIFKIIFGDFFDKVGEGIELKESDESVKKSIEKLQALMNDNEFNSKFPFINEKKLIDKEQRKDTENVKKFLENIKNQEKALNQGKNVEKSIISDENFWKNIYLEQENDGENELYKVIRKKIKDIKGEKNDIPQEEFLIKLSEIEFPKEPSTGETTPTETEQVEANPEQDIKSLPLENQLERITKLPADIYIEGQKINVYIEDGKNIVLGDKKYSVSILGKILLSEVEVFRKIDFKAGKLIVTHMNGIKEVNAKDLKEILILLVSGKNYITEVKDEEDNSKTIATLKIENIA